MLKMQAGQSFKDGRKFYSYVLARIHEYSQPLAKMIHDTPSYKPFRVELPNTIYVLTDEVAVHLKRINTFKVLEELPHDELLNELYETHSIKLSFKDTTLRKEGFEIPMPVAEDIVENARQIWNSLYPQKISFEAGTRRNKNTVVNTQVNIRSYKHQIGDYRAREAFSGTTTIRIYGDPIYIQQVNTLLRFVKWSGIGHKRTMGMGAVNIAKTW